MQLAPEFQAKLRLKGFFSAKDVLTLSSFELMEVLDITNEEAALLLAGVGSLVAPAKKKASSLVGSLQNIPTGLQVRSGCLCNNDTN